MANIPPITELRFYQRRWFVESLAVIPPIITIAVATVPNFADPAKERLGFLLAGAAVWLLVASIAKVLLAYRQDKEEKSKQEYDGLLGTLHVLYGSVRTHLKIPEQGEEDKQRAHNLRVTIHRVVPNAKDGQDPVELEQMLPYVGGGGKGSGRRFSIRSGIIGRAAREKTPYASSRTSDDHAAFIEEMKREWSYTEQDALTLTHDRQAWMAVPIFGKTGSVVAVVYLDSKQRNAFDKPAQTVVLNCCTGVTSYITERYT
jgi:putative methionine-R-sulfoxide reductase with GAF domain